MLTDNGNLLLSFFCTIVAEVTANKEINENITPIIGILMPISKPKTIIVPINAYEIPTHCFQETSSFKIGPANIFVNIGCIDTIKAEILAGKPMYIE